MDYRVSSLPKMNMIQCDPSCGGVCVYVFNDPATHLCPIFKLGNFPIFRLGNMYISYHVFRLGNIYNTYLYKPGNVIYPIFRHYRLS